MEIIESKIIHRAHHLNSGKPLSTLVANKKLRIYINSDILISEDPRLKINEIEKRRNI